MADAISILNPEKVYLTHINNEEEINDWYSSLSDKMKEKVIISHDGETVEL